MIVKDDDMTDTVKKRIKVEYGTVSTGTGKQHEIFDADSAEEKGFGTLRIVKDGKVVGAFAPGRWDGWYFID